MFDLSSLGDSEQRVHRNQLCADTLGLLLLKLGSDFLHLGTNLLSPLTKQEVGRLWSYSKSVMFSVANPVGQVVVCSPQILIEGQHDRGPNWCQDSQQLHTVVYFYICMIRI